MNKGIKTEVLEHWMGIDFILFGDKNPKDVLKEDSYKNYITTKGAFLSNLYEIYMLIGYNSDSKFNTVKEMKENSIKLANEAKNKSKDKIQNESVLKLIKEEVSEFLKDQKLNEQEMAKRVVSRRHKAISLDSLVLENALRKGCKYCLTDWRGKVLIDAHKTLRDNLIDILY